MKQIRLKTWVIHATNFNSYSETFVVTNIEPEEGVVFVDNEEEKDFKDY